jgi:hypothetical protein
MPDLVDMCGTFSLSGVRLIAVLWAHAYLNHVANNIPGS